MKERLFSWTACKKVGGASSKKVQKVTESAVEGLAGGWERKSTSEREREKGRERETRGKSHSDGPIGTVKFGHVSQ